MNETSVRKFYSLYFAEWLFDIGDRNLLSLGDAFDKRISKIIETKSLIDNEVGLIKQDIFAALVWSTSEPKAEVDQSEVIKADKHFTMLAKTAPAEVRTSKNLDFTIWALGLRPDVFADYSYWSKFDSYSVQELAWLSTGLPPYDLAAETQFQKSFILNAYPLAEISRRRQLIERAFIGGRKIGVTSNDFRQWAASVGFEGHEKFQDMIEISADRYPARTQKETISHDVATESSDSKMQPRQFQTAAKIIAAMAVDCYGYVPNQKRSKATKDIINACDRAGLTVSNDTILKYLRAADKAIQSADK